MSNVRLVRWAAVALIAMVLVQGMSVRPATAANTGAACTGLSAYRGDLLAAGRRWVKGMRSDDLLGRSTRSFDQTDWATYAARAKQLMIDLKTVEPPAFAAHWHRAQIESARLRLNFAGWATLFGFDRTAEAFGPKVAALAEDAKAGKAEASAACVRFAGLADEWANLDKRKTAAS